MKNSRNPRTRTRRFIKLRLYPNHGVVVVAVRVLSLRMWRGAVTASQNLVLVKCELTHRSSGVVTGRSHDAVLFPRIADGLRSILPPLCVISSRSGQSYTGGLLHRIREVGPIPNFPVRYLVCTMLQFNLIGKGGTSRCPIHGSVPEPRT